MTRHNWVLRHGKCGKNAGGAASVRGWHFQCARCGLKVQGGKTLSHGMDELRNNGVTVDCDERFVMTVQES